MNVISIDKKAILHNLNILQGLQPHAEIFPVLKSNAYGHGLQQMVKILRTTNVAYLVVDSFPEYQIVKTYSDKPILLLGETLGENYRKYNLKRVTFCVYNSETLLALARLRRPVKVHLFINTGMQREGIPLDQLPSILDQLRQSPQLQVEGVLSHLHSADEESTSVDKQIDLFKKAYHIIVDAGYTPLYKHIGNSAGVAMVKDDFFNAFRPGIALYGYNPFTPKHPQYKTLQGVHPALSISSRIISSHVTRPGDGVGYGQTYTPKDREVLVTIPFGYAEGLPRQASGKLIMKTGRNTFHQVGRISMNLSTRKSDSDAPLPIGTKVDLISSRPSDPNSMQALAQASDTIVYECLVNLDKGMRREIV